MTFLGGSTPIDGVKSSNKTRMNQEELVTAWKAEENQPFTGWDFSYLRGRMTEELPPWSFMARAAKLMDQSTSVLDMGTGGGERILELRKHWPDNVVVTEDYPPNIRLAKEHLEPFGVKVVNVPLTEESSLPFENDEFDLVLNRHSELNCTEVSRILAPEGVFLTQQIHGLWAQDLLSVFGMAPRWPDATPEYYVSRLNAAGLNVEKAEEWQGKIIFHDVGAIVYYLKAVPWLVPDFSVKTNKNDLLRLERELQQNGCLAFEARKYLIEGKKTI